MTVTLGDINADSFDRLRSRLDFLREDAEHFVGRTESISDKGIKALQEMSHASVVAHLDSLCSRAYAFVDDLVGIRELLEDAVAAVDDNYQPEIKVVYEGTWLGPE